MTEPVPETTESPTRSWVWPVTWMVTVFLVVTGTVLVFHSCYRMPVDTIEQTGETIERVGKALEQVATAFQHGTITTSFISYATTLAPTHYLQFATLKQMELFRRSDEKTIAYVSLPEVLVEARAPIEYTYYVDLNAQWRFVLRDGVLHVYAPDIQFNQPAVDVSKIEYEVKKGRLFSAQVKEDLKKSISFLAREKARENIGLVRETGRRNVSDFVEQWLMRSFTDGKNHPVKVHFPEEEPADSLDRPIPPPLN